MEIEVKENRTVLGIVGALIGGLLGCAAIVLIGQLGYVASISGVALAFFTLKGYDLLNKGLDKTGIFVSILVMLAAPYLADRFSWALVIAEEFQMTMRDAFAEVHQVVAAYDLQADYWKDLLMIYAFTALGAFGTARNFIKPAEKKTKE